MRFKVGDKVRLTDKFRATRSCRDSDYWFSTAEVVEIFVDSESFPYLVRTFDGKYCRTGEHAIAPISDNHEPAKPKFKVGDYVRMTGKGRSNWGEIDVDYKGLAAKVVEQDDSKYPVRIMRSDCGMLWVSIDAIEHFKPVYEVGAKVRCKEEHYCSILDAGQVGEVLKFSVINWEPKYFVRFGSTPSWMAAHELEPADQNANRHFECGMPGCCDGMSIQACGGPTPPEDEPVAAGPELSVASTGAVRSKDADNVRYDLIAPIGLERVACDARGYYDCDDVFFGEPRASLGSALGEIYEFLFEPSEETLELLSFAFLDLAWSLDPDVAKMREYAAIAADYDPGLADYELIPRAGMEALAKTCHEGAVKYKPHNWLRGFPVWDLLNHGIRHIYLWLDGDRSEDHLGHAAWNVMAAIHSYIAWPELNEGTLCGPNCTPPPQTGSAK